MAKVALITGITGQDGSYLAELLLSKDYEVHGMIRRTSTINTRRLDHIYQDIHQKNVRLRLHYGDLTSSSSITGLISDIKPDEIYHLGSQTHVQTSFEIPEYTGDVTGLGTLRVLEAVHKLKLDTRVYNAASSEMFGDAPAPQTETTPFSPRSPYAAAKIFSAHTTAIYRDGHGIHASSGILFNHESPRRGETFVTRKITRAIAAIIAGTQDKVYLGNLDAKRDWGYAPEYVEAIWRMVQQDSPDDFAIGTGECHSVKEFLQTAFAYVDLDWQKYVEIDERYLRPLEVSELQADASKALEILGWKPEITFHDLAHVMVDADLNAIGQKYPGLGKQAITEKSGTWHDWS